MRMTTDKTYYGNYRFVVEFDSGSETGSNQLTVWVAEKADIDAVPLKQFGAAQLLSALIEPERSRLHAALSEEQRACRQPFELGIASIQQPFRAAGEKQGQKMPEKAKRKARKLREQMKTALQRLEVEFARRELWSLDRQWYDHSILQAQSRAYSGEFSLRDFYFEEANGPHIRNFCRKFALDEAYRQQVLARETRWARRNALFVRNLLSVVGEDALLSNGRGDDRQVHDFFRWVDAHVEEILAHPEYQRLKEEDSAFEPSAGELDPLILPAVEALNRIPGVSTRFSCQGVSGKVRSQGRELLVVSPHDEYAYVSFSELGQPARDVIVALLPSFPGITNARIPGNFALGSVLRSTGDNLRFRQELVELAERMLASVDCWSTRPGESGSHPQGSATVAVGPEDGPALGAIPPSRLAWLCQPEQIERTLHLLFYLNHWAKARERLPSADRQGLYRVEGTKAFLQEHLATLIAQARSTRQPIPDSELAALCLEPGDLLDIHWIRNRLSPGWSELDESETVQLDPEGLSLIAFEHVGATAHYIFHLPFRAAERLLPQPRVRDLKSRPGNSRESGEYFGGIITEEESLEHPVGEILRELGVDVAAVCPYRLTDKQVDVSRLARRYAYWDDEEDWDDEDWEVPSRLESHRRKGERIPGACPLCGGAVEPDPAPRIEHWRQNHHYQDLTVSQVAWLLGSGN